MANTTNFPGDVTVPGELRVTGKITPSKAKSDILAIAELQAFNVPWTSWRTYDALGTNLPGAAGTDDLGLVGGTHGTGHPAIQAGDVQGTSSTRYARAIIQLPWEYVAGQTVKLRFYAACLTNATDTTCTLDIVAYKMDGDNTISADLASAAGANNIKATAFANTDFTITATALSPGDDIDVLLSIAYVDGGSVETIPSIGKVQLLCDVR